MGSSRNQGGKLPEELSGVLPELFRQTRCEDWETMRSPLPRRDCTVYFLRSRQFRLPELILKIYRKDAVGKMLAKSIHKQSLRFSRAGTAEFAVPEPVMFIQDENTLAMEYINAPLAGSLLRKGFHSKQTRESITRKSAGWLRWFHGQSELGSEPFDAARFNRRLAKTLEKVSTQNPTALSRDPFLNTCVEFAGKIATGMDGVLMPHARVHGDFTPFNLFAHGDKTIGFDYQVKHRQPISHDICRFLLYLELSQIIPTRPAEQRKYGCRKEDLELFMASYGEMGRELVENELWQGLQFMEVVRRITSLSLPRSSQHPFRVIEMAYLRRNARHLLETLR